MQRFDCLSRDCPLFGPHLLEASAGTGKTFSIEHISVRLILEGIEIEQILVVTFTRAATRELKTRIRSNLEKALTLIQAKEAGWDYLQNYLGADEAIRNLNDALAGFDQSQIFTIHGFCYRMLKEFAFEAGIGFSLADPDEGNPIPQRLKQALCDFLENGVEEGLLCREQLSHVMKQFESEEQLTNRLLRLEKVEASSSFSDIFAKCKAALHWWEGPIPDINDFHAIAKNFRAEVKGDFESQMKALGDLENPASLRALLKERGSLFKFLDPQNQKVKTEGPTRHPFFDWARMHIAPLLNEDPFLALQGAWNPIAEKVLAEEEHLDPDQILVSMKKALENERFASHVREKYGAAIIDEFQDTDALQWDIFHRLFLEHPLRALYLVGDPKQSIYRFRKADVYTYLRARDFLGEEHTYQLDTNFRSSKQLVSALNALFNREWLPLPKLNRTLPYHPVKAGSKMDSHFPDEKGAIHFFVAEGEPNPLFEEAFLPFAINEIERLNLKKCALLVKDRFQAEKALNLLRERNIPAIAKSQTPLGKTTGFQALRELFEAVMSPRDQSAAKIVMAGPFATPDLPFSELKVLLEEKGLVPFARHFAKHFDADMMQIFELLFEWEKKEGFSFEGLKRQLKIVRERDADHGSRRRMEVNEEAVQIMTIHISKGLEFDVVFALGLASRTPEGREKEELDAEKLRQLYVAMTRAKRRLYVPFALSKKDPSPGTSSPMELFCQNWELLKEISKTESITFEFLSPPISLAVPAEKIKIVETPPPLPVRSYTPSYLNSFTTLAQTHETKWTDPPTDGFTLQTMPRGPETGIFVHKIFEVLFSSKTPLWRDLRTIDQLVAEQIAFTPLASWKEPIQQMVRQTVALPLQLDGEFICLGELEPNQLQVEVEFLYSTPPHFVKGFIDLIFSHRGKIYFLDWKTNWLENYEESLLREAIQIHNYDLQASLYAEAIQRYTNGHYGGAFYLFVRGNRLLYLGNGRNE